MGQRRCEAGASAGAPQTCPPPPCTASPGRLGRPDSRRSPVHSPWRATSARPPARQQAECGQKGRDPQWVGWHPCQSGIVHDTQARVRRLEAPMISCEKQRCKDVLAPICAGMEAMIQAELAAGMNHQSCQCAMRTSNADTSCSNFRCLQTVL